MDSDYIHVYLDHHYDRYCKFRDAYNIHAVHLKNLHNMITLPLLVITSATGVIASLDLPRPVGIIVGAASAVLTAVQRYCAFSERSENARMTAKSYAKILGEISNMRLCMRSNVWAASMTHETLYKFTSEIQTHISSARENALEIPWRLLETPTSVPSNEPVGPLQDLPVLQPR